MENDSKQILEFWIKISFWTLLLLFFVVFEKPIFAQDPLPTPILDSISINANGNPILAWEQNPDVRTTGYKIVRYDEINFWEEIATINGIAQTSYTDNTIFPCDPGKSIEYRIYAFVEGTNIESLWSKSLKSINLSQPQPDVCANTFTLSWTEYENMLPELKEYRIFASETGETGPFEEIGSTIATSFVYQNPTPGIQYTFMIRAVNSDGTKSSSSCKKSITSYAPIQPDWVYLRYATVEDFDHVKLEWTVGNNAKITKFKILRSTNGLTFDTIEEITHTGDFNPSTQFIDTSADFNAQSYYYQIRVCDSCGADMLASVNIARTVHLSGKPGITGNENELSWNHYKGWDFGGSGIGSYQIYRLVNGTPNQDGIDNPLFASLTSYTDDVSGFSTSEGVFNYYIVAYEKDIDNGFEAFKDSSVSNKIEIKQETLVILPNAFGPDLPPPDNVFKPVLAFIDAGDYSFVIFNKWGQLIFITEDPTQGWDGKFKGEYVPSDAYVYQLKYKTPQGQNLEKRGTVTVIR